jgi:hypothetical protein
MAAGRQDDAEQLLDTFAQHGNLLVLLAQALKLLHLFAVRLDLLVQLLQLRLAAA